jgi:hypothetical protein
MREEKCKDQDNWIIFFQEIVVILHYMNAFAFLSFPLVMVEVQ